MSERPHICGEGAMMSEGVKPRQLRRSLSSPLRGATWRDGSSNWPETNYLNGNCCLWPDAGAFEPYHRMCSWFDPHTTLVWIFLDPNKFRYSNFYGQFTNYDKLFFWLAHVILKQVGNWYSNWGKNCFLCGRYI